MIDLDKVAQQLTKEKKPFKRIVKKKAEFILFDFENPVNEFNFKGTDYYEYACEFITINKKEINKGNHFVQLPKKTAWLQLYDYFKSIDVLKKKNITLEMRKKDNLHYTYNTVESIE